MALTVGVNSWVTIAEADTYLSEKFGIGTTWTALNNAEKEAALISAYRWIMRLSLYSISPLAASDAVKFAQIELALYLVQWYEEHDDRSALYAQGVRDFSISKWKEKLVKPEIPIIVDELLDDFKVGLGGYFPTVTRELEQ